eukprot:COSAG04_NODE_6469_length_1320_cov_1.572482_3_plen_53_part_01
MPAISRRLTSHKHAVGAEGVALAAYPQRVAAADQLADLAHVLVRKVPEGDLDH